MSLNLNKVILSYQKLINDTIELEEANYTKSDVAYWKDVLFVTFLTYCLPISLFALLPGVYFAIATDNMGIAVVDLLCFFVLVIATFGKSLSLYLRKFLVIGLFYVLAIFLITKIGYIGPGVFYLMTMTILISLVFPIKYAYFSVLSNTLILVVFALMIKFPTEFWPLARQYTVGLWIALSSNLVFVGLVTVLLIHKIFSGLQVTIYKKDKLRENYQRIFDNSPTPMWVFDLETLKFLTVNHAAIEKYGFTKEEFLAMTIQDLRPEDTREAIAELVLQNREESKFKKRDILHRKKNGELVHVTIESNPLHYKGRPAKLVLATDITAELLKEQATYAANLKIKQSEASLQAIFQSTAEGFLLIDDQYTILTFNDKAEKSILFNKNSLPFLKGASIFDYVPESRHGYFSGVLAKVQQGNILTYDRMFIINGDKIWIHYTLTPVYDGEQVKGICISGRDISAYRRYIKTIEAQNKKLTEISWAQSHLVRAPVVNIMGLMPLLLNTATEEERQETLKLLEKATQELDRVIKEIVFEAQQLTVKVETDVIR